MGRRKTVGIKFMTPEQRREYQRAWRIRNGKQSAKPRVFLNRMTIEERREYERARRYRMTVEQYRRAMKSKTCDVCGTTANLVLDHCHVRMVLRGVVCKACNSALGFMDDDPALLRQAADYLDSWAGRGVPCEYTVRGKGIS